jgi:glycosyltransferase involved in cell wall biosynthesis
MAERMRISIAMALYNGERFVLEQLESFVRQTRLPDELVISDDCSGDRGVEIAREFAARAPFPVRILINDENGGCSKNFERAIAACTGDLIFISDWDDVWEPSKLMVTERAFEQWPKAGIVISGFQRVDENLSPTALGADRSVLWKVMCKPWSSTAAFANGKAFNHQLPVGGCRVAFRAKYKPLILPFPDNAEFRRMSYDAFIVWAIVGSGSAGVLMLSDKLLLYRRHAAEMTGYISSRRSWKWVRDRLTTPGRRWLPLALMEPVMERIESPVAADFCVNSRLRDNVLRHWRARVGMPPRRLARIPAVARELASLRYHRFSSGFLTVAQDLLFIE